MSQRTKSKPGKNAYFWRACRYLWPYRRMVACSVVAAFFVGLAVTGGLGAMLPIMRVLINGDTVQGWVYRQTVGQRMVGARFAQDPMVVQIFKVDAGSPAARSGLETGMVITDAPAPASAPPSPFPADSDTYRAAEILRRIAWADRSPLPLTVGGRVIPVDLRPAPSFMRAAQRVCELLPVKPVQAVAAVFGIMAVIAILGQAVRFVQEYFSDKAGILAVNDIRRQLYDRVLHVPMQFFGTQGTSDVTSRLVSDAANLQDGFKQVLGQSIQEPIKAVMAMSFALVLSWKLTLFIIVFAPVMAVIVRKFGKKMRRASRAALRSSSAMLGQIEGTLLGIRVVKGATAERFERRRYMKVMAKLVIEQMRMSRIDAFSAPVLETVIMLMAGCVVLFATHMVVSQRADAGEIPGGDGVAGDDRRIASPRQQGHQCPATFQRRGTADLRDHGPAGGALARIRRRRRLRPLPPLQNQISFEEITFSYPNANSPALCGLNLTVSKGQSVAIVGRNGSGKTTLLALLPRFFDPDQGRIRIDGTDIRNVTLPSLRKQISIVTQESVIFPGTIAQNIAYGNPLAEPDARLGCPAGTAAGDRGRRPPVVRPRIHPGKTAGIRHGAGRAWRPALRWAEAAHLHRPRHLPQVTDPDPRRGHQPGGRRKRAPDPAGHRAGDARAHDVRDRAPPGDDPVGRHHRGDGAWPHRRAGEA